MKTAYFQAGMLLTGLIFLIALGLEGPKLGKEMGLIPESDSKTVLVFVIPDPSAARQVRSAVTPDRIVWQGATGLALVGERVVASSLDGASDVIMEAGWIEYPIRIVRLDGGLDDSASGGGASGASGASSEDRTARLRELTQKQSLTRGEQMFILSAMNDGVAI